MPTLNYLLDDDDRLQVEVAPRRGGMVTGLRFEGRELLYLERDTYLDRSKNVRGGIPVLFPWAGPLPAGTFPGTGKLPQHGVGRTSEWDVAAQGPGWLELALSSSPASLEIFPWEFETRWTYRVESGRLRIDQLFLNRSDRPMPVQVGLHPYFRVGPKAQLVWELPVKTYRDNEDGAAPERDFAGLDLERDVLDWELRGVSGNRAALADPSQGIRIELEWSDLYRYLVVWSLKGKDFCCLEPWSAPRFAQQSGQDLFTVEPGQSRSAWVSIQASRC